ncbi:hypothetical protein JDW15_07935 [Aerococcaceae bacterium zg-ZJ1578]|uniref:hypothetical protein n=1 Tax=Aerococcaceae bacterium zg-252 TaxID=2796928 RepID=UPI001A1ADDB9|nr:hypothetical protein [Aerococcaceae bacterium zg-1578]
MKLDLSILSDAISFEQYIDIISSISQTLMESDVYNYPNQDLIKRIFNKFIVYNFHEDLLKCNIHRIDQIGLIYCFINKYKDLFDDEIKRVKTINVCKNFLVDYQILMDREYTDYSIAIMQYIYHSFKLDINISLSELDLNSKLKAMHDFLYLSKIENILTYNLLFKLKYLNDSRVLKKYLSWLLLNNKLDEYIELIVSNNMQLSSNGKRNIIKNNDQLKIESKILLYTKGDIFV